MRRRVWRLCPAFLVALTLTAPRLASQRVLTGTIREAGTGRPLQGVEVLLEGADRNRLRTSWQASSDKNGVYTLVLYSRAYLVDSGIVLIRAVGYTPLRLLVVFPARDTAIADATLTPFAAPLDPIIVTGAVKQPRGMGREEFEDRRRMGFGEFIDSLEMRRSEDRRLSDVLRGRKGVVLAQSRYVISARTGCYMQILYDGQTAYSPSQYALPVPEARVRGTRPARPQPPEQPFDINSFSVSGLEAVEIYRSLGDTPLQFGGAAAGCGTLVLWSRRGGPRPR